jgi:hypothetical protein
MDEPLISNDPTHREGFLDGTLEFREIGRDVRNVQARISQNLCAASECKAHQAPSRLVYSEPRNIA